MALNDIEPFAAIENLGIVHLDGVQVAIRASVTTWSWLRCCVPECLMLNWNNKPLYFASFRISQRDTVAPPPMGTADEGVFLYTKAMLSDVRKVPRNCRTVERAAIKAIYARALLW